VLLYIAATAVRAVHIITRHFGGVESNTCQNKLSFDWEYQWIITWAASGPLGR
jgi:hypothetical protein